VKWLRSVYELIQIFGLLQFDVGLILRASRKIAIVGVRTIRSSKVRSGSFRDDTAEITTARDRDFVMRVFRVHRSVKDRRLRTIAALQHRTGFGQKWSFVIVAVMVNSLGL